MILFLVTFPQGLKPRDIGDVAARLKPRPFKAKATAKADSGVRRNDKQKA
jgi:hypothetical protein